MYYDIIESGNRIKELRTDRSLRQEEVSVNIGISLDGYRKIERGTNGAKIDTLIYIADYFGVSLDFIVAGQEPKSKLDVILMGRTEAENKFIIHMVKDMIKNMDLVKE